ncbi:MAG TPA: hypothetical protein VFV52_13130 [Bacilli bacterium]|nr:hypothetical protein [Bacilli bacterium]
MVEPREPLDEPTVSLTPEEVVNDYLIGKYELEKLRHGFQAPVEHVPCEKHRSLEAAGERRDS